MLKKKSSGGGLVTALVITCIDFRLIDEAVTYFDGINLNNKYDEMIVAGASLGYNTSCNKVQLPSGYNPLKSASDSTLWTKCVDDHISISSALHSITEIFVMDHMDCGAYKAQLNSGQKYSVVYDEIRAHVEQLNAFRTAINTKYQNPKYNAPQIPFKVVPLLMRLNGTVDINPTYWRPTKVSFNLNINEVVVIGSTSLSPSLGLTTIASLPIPETTLQLLKYTVMSVGNYGPLFSVKYDVNNVCYIQNDTDLNGFISDEQYYATSEYSYNLKLNDSLAYINITVSSPTDQTGVKYVVYTFDSVDYIY